MAHRVHKGADSRVGHPHEPGPILHGTEGGKHEVLLRTTRVTEPGVVRDVHEEFSPLVHEFPRNRLENRFEADQDAETIILPAQGLDLLSGPEIPDTLYQPLELGDPIREGHVLAERKQLHLVIPAGEPPVRP
jgi:hypothetical protein